MSDLLKQGDFTERIQDVRDYDRGPRKLVIDLSNPVDELEFNIAGNLFYVLESATSSDTIGVRFNEIHQPQFDFSRSQGVILDFDRIFITVPDGLTGNMEIMYGSGAPQLLYPLDGRTATIDLLTDSRDYLNSIDGKFDNYLTHDIPLTAGIDWAADDPVAGEISWTQGRLDFAGSSHDITAGSTANDFVYWDSSSPTQFTGTDTLADAIGPGKWIMAYNAGGTPRPAFQNKVIHGGIIEAGTIEAGTIISVGYSQITDDDGNKPENDADVTADHQADINVDNIQDGATYARARAAWRQSGDITKIAGGQISTGTVDANKLNVGQLSAITAALGSITSGEITLTLGTDKLLRIDNNGVRASWDNGSTWHGIITVTGSEIGITADEIKAGTILADRIAAGTLSGVVASYSAVGPIVHDHDHNETSHIESTETSDPAVCPGDDYRYRGGYKITYSEPGGSDTGYITVKLYKNSSKVFEESKSISDPDKILSGHFDIACSNDDEIYIETDAELQYGDVSAQVSVNVQGQFCPLASGSVTK